MQQLNEGDVVDIFFTNGNELRNVTIYYLPSATGDLLQVKEKDGTLHAINTGSSIFDQIIKSGREGKC